MAAFAELDWTRFDVWAAVALEGVVVVETAHRDACLAWLRQNDYGITSIDFSGGISPAVVALGERFHWEDQFGYKLTAEKRNLDALRDGFEFDLEPGQGHVLELLDAEVAYREDARWLAGLLAIAHEYSRWQLALGARFFVTLFLDRDSPLIGVPYEKLAVPGPFRTAARHGGPFAPTPAASATSEVALARPKSERRDLDEVPDDIRQRVVNDFGLEATEKVYRDLLARIPPGLPNGTRPRHLRCILHLANGDRARLEQYIELCLQDTRDVMLQAEYETRGSRLIRVRDFNYPDGRR
jgi:hypothetical protein